MTVTNGPRSVRLRTDAERDALGAATRYSRTHGLATPAEGAFLEALGDARRDVLRRLVRGLLRGRPEGLPDPILAPREPSELPGEPAPLSALTAGRLRSLAAALPEECHGLALLPFPASETLLVAPVAARHGYDRFRFVGPILRWSPGTESSATTPNERGLNVPAPNERRQNVPAQSETEPNVPAMDGTATAESPERTERVSHPVDLVPLLEREGAFSDADQAQRIRAELAESVANLGLAQLAKAVHASTVESEDEAPAAGSGSDAPTESFHAPTASVLAAIATRIPAADPAAAFERIVTDGHPFHPAGKLRRGMNAADGLAYAPEFADRIDLRFVGIDREYALETGAESAGGTRLTDRLYATFDGLEAALERALPGSRETERYAIVPVHPLQYHRTIPDRYARQRADGPVVPIPEYAHPATPQLNLRTVVPYRTERTPDEPLPRCKLAIPVQTTNVVRTLSPQAVANGPRITDVLRAIEDRESFETLGLLAETAATCYYPPGGPHRSGEEFDDARHLSGLLRMNPQSHPLVPEDGYPVVASSLVATEPATGRPLVRALIERFGTSLDEADTADAALAFIERYAVVVVPEQLRLLCAYGVALESHLQNSLVVFDAETAKPLATLVRDFGGIRVHRERLAERGYSFDPYPESDVDATGEADLYRKLYYALFQNHLAELVAVVSHELPVDERACWARIRVQCERAFETIRADVSVPETRVRRDERALFEPSATHKALTAMRLRGKRHEYVTSEVANPLSRAGRDRIEP